LTAVGWPERAGAWSSQVRKMFDQMWIPGSTVPGEFTSALWRRMAEIVASSVPIAEWESHL
ncbi:MAG: hypothetical protein ACRDFR_06555, partial [Candidatus Limnocylindria bacterium]